MSEELPQAPAYKIFNRLGWVDWDVYWRGLQVIAMSHNDNGYTCCVFEPITGSIGNTLVHRHEMLSIDCPDTRFHKYFGIQNNDSAA